MPPALILIAEKDELKPDGEQFAKKLREFGVPTFIYCQNGIGHLAGHGAKASPQAKESLDVAVVTLGP